MKIFILCLIVSVNSLTLADVKNDKKNVAEKKLESVAIDKSSDSKSKRAAPHVSGVYHGPSYKYLPPSSISSYDSYSGGVGNSGVHVSGIGSGHHSSGIFHGLGYVPSSSYHSSGHQGLDFISHYTGHGSSHHSGGFKGSVGSNSGATFSVGRPHSYAIGHGYSSSAGVGYKSHSLSATSGGSGSSYHYSKGNSGSFTSPASSGFGSVHGLRNSHGTNMAEVHHGDHVHNGDQEHIYIISSGYGGLRNSDGGAVSGGQKETHEVPKTSYLPPIQQHLLPSSSYGVPLTNSGESYNTKYHGQPSGVLEHGPAYAAGHKGLGYFGFTSNKPQVLHTSITGTSFQQPSYSKAPFKPSTFLGAKYEGSVKNDAPGQQYLPPSSVSGDITGYDNTVSSGSESINYQEPSYQQTIEVQNTSVHEPDSAYLPPKNNDVSFNELPSAPSGNYLPPINTYGVPYSH
ncbi:uncharacterized protein ACRADG_007860 [Cochliomyia hominivorax]